MSDTSQGPGWWQASDGKWYAPELYPQDWPKPNPTTVDTQESDAATTAAEPAGVSEPETRWPKPDHSAEPAADEPTLTEGIPAVSRRDDLDATTVQPRVDVASGGLPTPPEVRIGSDTPPERPPTTWEVPGSGSNVPLGSDPVITPRAPAPTLSPVGGVLGLVGGGAMVLGSFLAWANAVGPGISGEVNGLTGSNGWGTLVAGLVVAGCGGLTLGPLRKSWAGIVMALGALAGIGLAVFSYIDINSTSDDLPGRLIESGVAPAVAEATSLDIDVGLWIVVGGGALALLGAIFVMARRD